MARSAATTAPQRTWVARRRPAGLAGNLFRRHVLNGADDGSGAGEWADRARGGKRSGRGKQWRGIFFRETVNGGRFGQTKIHQLGAGFGEHDISGFEVAMKNAGA